VLDGPGSLNVRGCSLAAKLPQIGAKG
jgi:hypothetical protein